MPTPDQTPTQAQVDQAIEWLVKLRYDSPGPRTEQQFQRWLASHPQHAQAWQRVSSLGDELASLPAELSRQTLAGTERRRMSRRDHLKLLSVLALGGAAGWAAREPLGLSGWMADSRTATGERRELLGSDGSLIRLNTASAIDLRYSADQRRLTLLRGEISLDSNVNDNRPFSIDTPVGTLGTQGGQLLLRENAQGLLVAVRRGEVTFVPRLQRRAFGQAWRGAAGVRPRRLPARHRAWRSLGLDRRRTERATDAPGRVHRRAVALPPRRVALRAGGGRAEGFRHLPAGRHRPGPAAGRPQPAGANRLSHTLLGEHRRRLNN